MSASRRQASFVADVGGTNTRCALLVDGRPGPTAVVSNAEHGGIEAALEAALAALGPTARPARAALGIAAPIEGDAVRLINIDWRFSIEALRRRLGLDELIVVNDFTAVAWALPDLGAADCVQVGGGSARAGQALAVLGVGTGLGVSGLLPAPGGWSAIAGEGGHVTLAASNDEEARVIAAVRARCGHCSAERLLSGAGLGLLHQILAGTDGERGGVAADVVAEHAMAGEPTAQRAMSMFFELLGTVAADLALTLGAFGGVYVAGGIVPANQRLFLASGFRRRFEDKGRYRDYLARIPTLLITAAHPALRGLAYLLERAGSRR